jgi:hypothetical protein
MNARPFEQSGRTVRISDSTDVRGPALRTEDEGEARTLRPYTVALPRRRWRRRGTCCPLVRGGREGGREGNLGWVGMFAG